jgi:SAM-dependent methyltransferase
MTDAYRDDLAYIHDAGFGFMADSAAPVLRDTLRQSGLGRGLVIDLGCGSGILSEAMAAAGYDVLGIDLSLAMLELARARVPSGRFRQESILSAELESCVAVAAVGEIVNYLFDRGNTASALPRLLRRIHRALVPGGVLLFDVATPGRVPGGTRKAHVEGDGWAVLVDAEEKDGRLTRRITSFRRAGELYRRDFEVHEQRLLRPAEVQAMLRAAGFRVRRLRGYGTFRFSPGLVAFLARKA